MQRLVHLGLYGPIGSEAEQKNADRQHEILIDTFAAEDAKGAERAASVHIEHARSLAMKALVETKLPVVLG